MVDEQLAPGDYRTFKDKTPDYMQKAGYVRVANPRPGDIVYYNKFLQDGTKTRKVKIAGGYYLESTYGGVSNRWSWYEMKENGCWEDNTVSGEGYFYVRNAEIAYPNIIVRFPTCI